MTASPLNEQLSIRALQKCGDVEAEGAVWGLLAQVYARLLAIARQDEERGEGGGHSEEGRGGAEANAMKLLCLNALVRHRDIG